MSVIGFREWELWQNSTYFARPLTLRGQFVVWISPALMAQQTIEFVFERIEDLRRGGPPPTGPAAAYVSLSAYPRPTAADGSLALYKVAPLATGDPIEPVVTEILEELRVISLCLDFPLTCNRIEYEIPPISPEAGIVLVAARRPLSRGLAFEVDERGIAGQNLWQHSTAYGYAGDRDAEVAAEHYLTGLTLLGLEDQFAGLVDAAFMQFYQGCESLLLRGPRETVTDAKKRLAADPNVSDSRSLQIVVAHVWKARHKFFGHRGTVVPRTASGVFGIAKQVLVARWLCRRLLDMRAGVPRGLCREMRLYHEWTSEEFRGTVAELEAAFALPGTAGEPVEIFDAGGSVVEIYSMH